MEQTANHATEEAKANHKAFCNAPKKVEEAPKELPQHSRKLSFPSAADAKEKTIMLASNLKRAIRIAILNTGYHGDNSVELQSQADFNKSDIFQIKKIIGEATAHQINPFTCFSSNTIVHQLCSGSDSSPVEFHRLVRLMIMLEKESVFKLNGNTDKNTVIHLAIKQNIELLPATVDLLSKKCHFDFNTTNECGQNVLHMASKNTSLTTLERILHHYKADLNAQDNLGNTALHYAACRGNSTILQYLAFLRGVDVNAKNVQQQTPLHSLLFAPVDNFTTCLNILVNAGAEINETDMNGRNMLFYAVCQDCSLKLVKQIVKLGCNSKSRDTLGQSILHVCASMGRVDLLKYFLRHGVKVDQRDSDMRRSALHFAALNKNYNAFEYLVFNGADVNLMDIDGDTPLTLAVTGEMVDPLQVIEMMKGFGVELDLKNKSIENFLVAVFKTEVKRAEMKEIVDLVLDWSVVNEDGQSFLHLMAATENRDLVEYLIITKGMDVNKKSFLGRTPLHVCVASECKKFLSMAVVLLLHGANINATDNFGFNALFVAAKNGKGIKVLKRLIHLGANWNVTDTFGNSIVHILSREGLVDGLKYFLSLGANANAKNGLKETPLHSAVDAKQNFIETVIILMKYGVQLVAVDLSGQNACQVASVDRRQVLEYLFNVTA